MKIIKLLLLFTGLAVLASCTKYPATDSRLLEDLAILTQYDKKADFKSYQTFSIVDSIAFKTDKDSGYMLNANVQAVLTRIKENMTQRGYHEVDHELNPDLAINVIVFEITNTYVYSYYPGWWWGGYYPPYYWGYPYGGYYYPYYPVYYSSYTSGTMVIDMGAFKDIVDNKVPIVWSAFIRGLLTGNHTISQINEAIDQAFAQTKPFQQ